MVIDLKTGMGVGQEEDSFEAGKSAATKALERLGDVKPDVLIVFSAPKFDLQPLLNGIKAAAKGVPMVGGTTAGEISSRGLSVDSVTVLALRSKDISFTAGIGKGIDKSEVAAGSALARSILKKAPARHHKTLLMLPDGLAGDGLKVISGVQKILGENFEIVGGSLGDEDQFKNTYQFYNGKVYQNAVVGLLFSGAKIRTASGVRSGWQSVGGRFRCTKAKGNVVYTFDNKSALDTYTEFLGAERAKKLPAIGLEYPMGLVDETAKIEGYDYFQIRCPVGIDKKAGTVTFAAAIPEGKEVTLTYSSRTSIINGSQLAAKQAKNTLGVAKPKLILMFSCVARKMVLGRRTNEEINKVKKIFGANIPIFGFYTYGEIGPIDKRIASLGKTRWHNETVVLWVLGE